MGCTVNFLGLFLPHVTTHTLLLSGNSEHSNTVSQLCQQEQTRWGGVKTSDHTALNNINSANIKLHLICLLTHCQISQSCPFLCEIEYQFCQSSETISGCFQYKSAFNNSFKIKCHFSCIYSSSLPYSVWFQDTDWLSSRKCLKQAHLYCKRSEIVSLCCWIYETCSMKLKFFQKRWDRFFLFPVLTYLQPSCWEKISATNIRVHPSAKPRPNLYRFNNILA